MLKTLKIIAIYVDNDKVRKLIEKYDLNKKGIMGKEGFMKEMLEMPKLGETKIVNSRIISFISVLIFRSIIFGEFLWDSSE